MTKVTLIGAGGKMGCRLTDNLKATDYEMSYLEISPEGIERLRGKGVDVSDLKEFNWEADIVIFAVPDTSMKTVTSSYVPQMKRGALGVFLDPAAPLAGVLPDRADIAYFASHPSHPSVFNWEADKTAHFDYFGGIAARQTIVCALIQGDDKYYGIGEELSKAMYAPVTTSHRITLRDMGILEPALSETFCGALITKMKEAVDLVVAKGVPRQAAHDFFYGHVRIELALLFGQLPGGQFSDAAKKAIKIGEEMIFKEDWKQVFDDDNIAQQIKAIT